MVVQVRQFLDTRVLEFALYFDNLIAWKIHKDCEDCRVRLLQPVVIETLLNGVSTVTEVDDFVTEVLGAELAVAFVYQSSANGDVQVGQAGDKRGVDERKVVSVRRQQSVELGLASFDVGFWEFE